MDRTRCIPSQRGRFWNKMSTKSCRAHPIRMSWVAAMMIAATVRATPEVAASKEKPSEPLEYCSEDNFNATCPTDHVIIMTHAEYGRMRTGRCTKIELSLGCSKDVLDVFSQRCTGRRTCHVPVSDLKKLKPCGSDYTPYLEAAYMCAYVPYMTSAECRKSSSILLTSQTGYLITSDPPNNKIPLINRQSPGSPRCPWIVQVQSGQQIEVSMLPTSKTPIQTGINGACSTHLIIKDGVGGSHDAVTRKMVSLCDQLGLSGSTVLFTSKKNKISLAVERTVASEGGPLVLEYKARGCPDVTNTTYRRVIRKNNTLEVRCNNTEETWYLTCDDKFNNQWIGDYGNCSTGNIGKPGRRGPTGSRRYLPEGILLAVLIGMVLGVLIGSLLLIIVHCMRKKQASDRRRFHLVPQEQAKYPGQVAEPSDGPRTKTTNIDTTCPCIVKDTGVYGHSALCHYSPYYPAVRVNTHPVRVRNDPPSCERTLYHTLNTSTGPVTSSQPGGQQSEPCALCDAPIKDNVSLNNTLDLTL